MKTTILIANDLRQVYFGGNWTASNLKQLLEDVSFEKANEKMEGFNSIPTITLHIYYYSKVQLDFLSTGLLKASDKDSFNLPTITNEQEWQTLLKRIWKDVELLALQIEDLDDNLITQDFYESKYGTFYRNLQGNVLHAHNHLGQIAIIKKLLHSKCD